MITPGPAHCWLFVTPYVLYFATQSAFEQKQIRCRYGIATAIEIGKYFPFPIDFQRVFLGLIFRTGNKPGCRVIPVLNCTSAGAEEVDGVLTMFSPDDRVEGSDECPGFGTGWKFCRKFSFSLFCFRYLHYFFYDANILTPVSAISISMSSTAAGDGA